MVVLVDPGRLLPFEKCLHARLAFLAGADARDRLGRVIERGLERSRGNSKNQFLGSGDRLWRRSQDLRDLRVDQSIESEVMSNDMFDEAVGVLTGATVSADAVRW